LGIDESSSLPMLYDLKNNNYFSEGFLDKNNGTLSYKFDNRKVISNVRKGSALISLEANVTPMLQSTLDGSSFLLQKIQSGGE
jgi:hypothetical protein